MGLEREEMVFLEGFFVDDEILPGYIREKILGGEELGRVGDDGRDEVVDVVREKGKEEGR